MRSAPECILEARAGIGECPLWSLRENRLWWLDITACRLHRFDPYSGHDEVFELPEEPGCLANAGETLLVALRSGVHRFDPRDGSLVRLSGIDYDSRTTRFNDGRCDRAGRFWLGTMFEPRTSSEAALYRFDAKGLARVRGNVKVSNGLAFSPDDHWLYWADSPERRIMRYEFDCSRGEIGDGSLFQSFEEGIGRPDGAAIDKDGCYWIALYDGGAVMQIAPDGRRLRTIPVPVRCPTMVCFGGEDLSQLFITSARSGRSEQELAEYPLSGAVFVLDPGTSGLPEPIYGVPKPSA